MRSRITAPLIACAALALASCAQLLPREKAEVSSPWASFEQARDAISRIEPGTTTVAQLTAAGLDPYLSPNVTLLSFSDVLLRFPNAGSFEQLDIGLRQCLRAGKSCTGYSIAAKDTQRDRVGDFWLDAFAFKRTVHTTGWSFNALLLMVDDRVVYTLYGGQPLVQEQQVTRQPLGPVQNLGTALSLGQIAK